MGRGGQEMKKTKENGDCVWWISGSAAPSKVPSVIMVFKIILCFVVVLVYFLWILLNILYARTFFPPLFFHTFFDFLFQFFIFYRLLLLLRFSTLLAKLFLNVVV